MRFNNLQAVRTAAAVGVVVFHLAHYAGPVFACDSPVIRWLLGGTWVMFPVPLFFAVSGFVLTHSLQSGRRGRFLIARAARMYPGYWVAAAAVLGLMAATGYPNMAPPRDLLGWLGVTLRPQEPGVLYVLGVEWSLVYEVGLSACLVVLSLFGLRRGLPAAAGVWLAVLGVKAAVWPGYAMDQFPTPKTFLLSAMNAPFLLGVLAYYLRGRGRAWRWPVFVAVAAFGVVVPARLAAPGVVVDGRVVFERMWWAFAVVAAGLVWFAAQVRQLPAKSRVVVAGDYTYGLYLVHVPLIVIAYRLLREAGWLVGSLGGVLVVGAVAVALGLLYGRFETWLHARLKPLTAVKPADVVNLPRGLLVRLWHPRARHPR
jgi:peptidoglycan/LPS O-acetylase OafA/YrhL